MTPIKPGHVCFRYGEEVFIGPGLAQEELYTLETALQCELQPNETIAAETASNTSRRATTFYGRFM